MERDALLLFVFFLLGGPAPIVAVTLFRGSVLAALRTAFGALPIVAATLAGWRFPFVGENHYVHVARVCAPPFRAYTSCRRLQSEQS